jgi:hypothetical protein
MRRPRLLAPAAMTLALLAVTLPTVAEDAPAAATAAECDTDPAVSPGAIESAPGTAAGDTAAASGASPASPAAGETGATATAESEAAPTLDGTRSSEAWVDSHGSTAMLDCDAPSAGQ